MNESKKMNLTMKTVENADAISSKILSITAEKLGFIPNMYAGMANNTALLDGYVHAYNSFRANSGFSPQEQEVVFLSISYLNDCDYCISAHSFIADKMTHVPEDVTNAIRNNTEIPDQKLRALSLFSKAVTQSRGLPSESDIENFLSAGYSESNILGVITGVGIKTMSNYFNHIYKTPLDEVFQERAWKKDN